MRYLKVGRLGREAPEGRSSDDAAVLAGLVGVGGDRFVGFEMQVALDRETERPARFMQLAHADEADLLGPSMAVPLWARLRRFKTTLPF